MGTLVRGKKREDSLVGERLQFGETLVELTERSDKGIGDNYRGIDRTGNAYFVKFQSRVEYPNNGMLITDVIREYEAITRLKKAGGHPNVIGDCKVGLWHNVPVIALPEIRGYDLRSIAEHKKGLVPEEVIDLGAQVCDGLAYAHRNGIIHRDIKPGNLMIDTESHKRNGTGTVKIIDFSFAWFIDEKEPQYMCYGTAWYIAPEVALERKVGEACDIYSLGITIYEILTGRVPFHHDDEQELLKMHVTCPPPQEPLEEAQVPPGIQNVVLRALEKNPAKRYKTAAEMKEALLEAFELSK